MCAWMYLYVKVETCMLLLFVEVRGQRLGVSSLHPHCSLFSVDCCILQASVPWASACLYTHFITGDLRPGSGRKQWVGKAEWEDMSVTFTQNVLPYLLWHESRWKQESKEPFYYVKNFIRTNLQDCNKSYKELADVKGWALEKIYTGKMLVCDNSQSIKIVTA